MDERIKLRGNLKGETAITLRMSDTLPGIDQAELEDFVEQYTRLNRRVQRPNDIYSILSGPREQKYQNTLKYFLDPGRPHGFGHTLLEALFDCVGFHEFNLAGQHIEIDDEVHVADADSGGIIDLIICGGSSLADHPRWAVFLELKVGAPEGTDQTTTYAQAETWDVNWFDLDAVVVDRLENTEYLYVKREVAADPDDETGTFEPVSWSDLVESFERETGESLFEYPNRSVIQFTDFIQSLKETENMDSSIDEAELNKRLDLYFEHSELIQQVENANSQFESDFEDLSTYLKDNWERTIIDTYDVEASGWQTSLSSNPKWQGILPAYWEQDPLNRRSTIKLYYRHSPTTDHLREQQLSFRLRLPPQRNVHTEALLDDGRSFNDVFTDNCTAEYHNRITDALDTLSVDHSRLGSASALVEKTYPLDPHNLADSYFDQLDTAVAEFCSGDCEFTTIMNEVFVDTYRDVFESEPEGSYQGCLRRRV